MSSSLWQQGPKWLTTPHKWPSSQPPHLPPLVLAAATEFVPSEQAPTALGCQSLHMFFGLWTTPGCNHSRDKVVQLLLRSKFSVVKGHTASNVLKGDQQSPTNSKTTQDVSITTCQTA